MDLYKDFTEEEIRLLVATGRGSRTKDWWINSSKEAIEARNKKISNSWFSKSDEEREEVNFRRGRSISDTWKNLSEEDKIGRVDRSSKGLTKYWKCMPRARREEISIILSLKGKKRWKNMSEEDKLRISKAWTQGWINKWTNMSEEDKTLFRTLCSGRLRGMSEESRTARGNRISEGLRLYHANKSPEEILMFSRNISEGWARKPVSEKKDFSKRKSEDSKKYWEVLPEEEKNERMRRINSSNKQGPTEPEVFLGMYLETRSPGEWKYNGSGNSSPLVRFGGKTPDFINLLGKKEVIEVFGVYWHPLEDEEDRIRHYKKYGFRCIVIWQYDCYLWKELDRIFGN